MKLKCKNNHIFTDEGIDKFGKQLPKFSRMDLCPICGEKLEDTDCYENHEIIKVGDSVRYLPTGDIFIVKEIYCDGAVGEFKLPAGLQRYRRSVVIPENFAGHYPVNDELVKICPECGKEISQKDLES